VTQVQRLPFDHDQLLPAADGPGPSRLDSDEDAELRRLHMLRGFGSVAGMVSSRYLALRGRDRRGKVREPEDAKLAIPIEKSLWSEAKAAAAALPPVPVASTPHLPESVPAQQLGSLAPVSSPTELVISDTREIFGELPQSRRGRGIFRR
jgi:hypothetical protein